MSFQYHVGKDVKCELEQSSRNYEIKLHIYYLMVFRCNELSHCLSQCQVHPSLEHYLYWIKLHIGDANNIT